MTLRTSIQANGSKLSVPLTLPDVSYHLAVRFPQPQFILDTSIPNDCG
jgi:hypothetical protein